MQLLTGTWAWYVSGPLITLVMLMLISFGKSFGVSSNLRTICTICGAGKTTTFFQFDWKNQLWNIMFIAGAILGGMVSFHFLNTGENVHISQETVFSLQKLGVTASTQMPHILPDELFGLEAILSFKGITLLLTGGFMVGFGARWAGGCTSGHAISGLSNLQFPSLVAVIGFFIGGLIMTHWLLPFLLG